MMKTTNWLLSLMACCALAPLTIPAATLCVDVNSANPTPPFTNWASAAATIQDAVDASQAGDTVVVTNGVYATGGRALASYPLMTNRVVVDRPVTLRSVNGPDVTIIQGHPAPGNILTADGAVRCAYLTNGARLTGFTLTNGWTGNGGGPLLVNGGG